MDKILDARFQKVENSLARLINSIATYNPSPGLATELVVADGELNEGLEQLAVHQNNYAKILALRHTSSNLDTQIRDTLTLLASTRQSLIATPATVFPTDSNPVSYSELLSYARRISKFTRPPSYREVDPQAIAVVGGGAGESSEVAGTGNGTPKEANTNGTTTPTVVTNPVLNGAEQPQTQTQPPSTAMDIDNPNPTTPGAQQPAPAVGGTALPPHLAAWVDPLSETTFMPWPMETKLRGGALASIQLLQEQGIDPASFDPEKSALLEAERKRKVEEEDREREEKEREAEERRRRRMESISVGGGGAAAEKKGGFALEGFDDDDED